MNICKNNSRKKELFTGSVNLYNIKYIFPYI